MALDDSVKGYDAFAQVGSQWKNTRAARGLRNVDGEASIMVG